MHSQYFGLCFIKMASYYTYLSSNCFSYSVISYRNLFKSISRELMKFFIGCLIFHDMTVPTLSPHHVHFLALPQLLWPHRALEHGVLFHDPTAGCSLFPLPSLIQRLTPTHILKIHLQLVLEKTRPLGLRGVGVSRGRMVMG